MLDTKGIEELFIETPLKKKKAKLVKNELNTVSSWVILRELLKRHYIDFQVIGFWLALIVIVWILVR